MEADRTDPAAAEPLGWIPAALEALEEEGLRRTVRHKDTPGGISGLVDLSSNDYLGLSHDARLADAAAAAIRTWGVGAGASRLVVGGSTPHRDLEAAVAAWKHTEDAIVFSSGYLANVGTIAALVGADDVILSDELNHASIIDGCRVSSARAHVYRHRDADHLRSLLRATAAPGRRQLVVTDGVFSMDGDLADLPGVCDAAEEVGAIVMVDDAHGSGVLGPEGRGTAALQGVADRVHVHLGTLSKSVGTAGGFVAGSAALVDWLRNRARSYVFDTAPPPAVMAAAAVGVRIARRDGALRAAAVANATRLAEGLGLPAPPACVLPLVVGDPRRALMLSAGLEEAGFLVVAIRPPSVPEGTARLRFTVTAAHDAEVIDRAAAVTRELLQR
ncbi:8-amino-7-oxononanoate synthase [soil metagenome]